jgi:hypothetical protein
VHPKDEFGGNTRLYRRVAAHEVGGARLEDFETTFAETRAATSIRQSLRRRSRIRIVVCRRQAASFVDPNVVAALADNAPATLGVDQRFRREVRDARDSFPTSVQASHQPEWRWLALLEAFVPRSLRRAERSAITRGRSLCVNETVRSKVSVAWGPAIVRSQ